jgi:hypothetical protein
LPLGVPKRHGLCALSGPVHGKCDALASAWDPADARVAPTGRQHRNSSTPVASAAAQRAARGVEVTFV